ncbi:hypothetical protein TNCV_3091632 [Trichonephila clavipes]|nr:hypothetical protein TNCV_3091632 [Trichonephila clavipes]
MIKKGENQEFRYKRANESRSGGPERKVQKGSEHRVNKRALSSNHKTNHSLTKYRKKSRRGRHNKEDQVDPEKAEKGTIVHKSRREQDQATRMPDEGINNGKTRRGEQRGQ